MIVRFSTANVLLLMLMVITMSAYSMDNDETSLASYLKQMRTCDPHKVQKIPSTVFKENPHPFMEEALACDNTQALLSVLDNILKQEERISSKKFAHYYNAKTTGTKNINLTGNNFFDMLINSGKFR